MQRRTFMKAALMAGGLAMMAGTAFLLRPAAVDPGIVREYNGADDPAALQSVVAQESQGRFVMVMFHATWCPYCQKLTTQVSEASARTIVPYSVVKVDVEKYGAIASAFKKEQGVPETHVFMNGQQIDMFVGSAADTGMIADYMDVLSREHGAMVTKPYISAPSPHAH